MSEKQSRSSRENRYGKHSRKAVRHVETGIEYGSIRECAKALGMEATGISQSANFIRETYMNQHFEFLEPE